MKKLIDAEACTAMGDVIKAKEALEKAQLHMNNLISILKNANMQGAVSSVRVANKEAASSYQHLTELCIETSIR